MNLLITGAWTGADKYISQIEGMGHKVVFLQQEKESLPCAYDWVEGVIGNGLFLYHPMILFPNLRYIQLTSAGYDRVPMEEVSSRGIKIHSARGVYSIPMAEFAVAGVLDLYKDMAGFRKKQTEHRWLKNRGLRELYGKRVVIVGCGSVGTECAKRFKAFGCEVVGVEQTERKGSATNADKAESTCESIRQPDHFDSIVTSVMLDEMLALADIVILALPLTAQTRGMIDERKLHLMGESAVLVNISRGAIVDQGALEKWNGAAVLDVFEEEPLRMDSPLWDRENVIITPHNSFVGDGNEERLCGVIVEKLRKLLTDE